MSDPTESGKSKFRLRAKPFVCVNAPQAESSTRPTTVHAMLEQNKTIAEARAKPLVPLVKRSRRRKRGYDFDDRDAAKEPGGFDLRVFWRRSLFCRHYLGDVDGYGRLLSAE
jgi:hypothetical protein